MEIFKKVIDVAKNIMSLLGVLLGIGVFAELIFGQFLGDFSVIDNMIKIVGQFGDAGFAGLLAMLLILIFINKDK